MRVGACLSLDKPSEPCYTQYMTSTEAVAEFDRINHQGHGGWALLRTTEGLDVAVLVQDVRSVYGRLDLKVTGWSGAAVWVESRRVRPFPGTEGGE